MFCMIMLFLFCLFDYIDLYVGICTFHVSLFLIKLQKRFQTLKALYIFPIIIVVAVVIIITPFP